MPGQRNDYHREYKWKRRLRALAHYGGSCKCCGENRAEFLSLDHKDGNGNKHRAEVGSGSNMVDWIIRNDFPPLFQVMCHNCNQARGSYRFCPHEDEIVS